MDGCGGDTFAVWMDNKTGITVTGWLLCYGGKRDSGDEGKKLGHFSAPEGPYPKSMHGKPFVFASNIRHLSLFLLHNSRHLF
jgi:hypothetical protein